jgi:hypothetical protein
MRNVPGLGILLRVFLWAGGELGGGGGANSDNRNVILLVLVPGSRHGCCVIITRLFDIVNTTSSCWTVAVVPRL